MRSLLYMALLFVCATAQAQEKEIIDLQPGITTVEALQGELYTYPQFREGIVIFKNGKGGKSQLNYCLLSKEMLYIDARRDTLALSNENDIKLVSFGKDTFYYNGKHFIQQTKNYGWLKIAQLKSIKEVDRKKLGGYGETVNGVAVSLTSLNASKLYVELGSTDKITLVKETRYFVSNGTNGFTTLNKNNVLKLLPADKVAAAYKYLNSNEVNFTIFSQVDRFLAALEVQQKDL